MVSRGSLHVPQLGGTGSPLRPRGRLCSTDRIPRLGSHYLHLRIMEVRSSQDHPEHTFSTRADSFFIHAA